MTHLLRLARIACPPAMLLFIGLRLFAHAHVADPSWIAGLYDGADLDALLDIVRAAYIPPGDVPAADGRAQPVEALVPHPVVAPVSEPLALANGPRGPPLPSLRVIGR